MNSLLDQMQNDAKGAQAIIGPMANTLAKLAAFTKARDAVSACSSEAIGMQIKSRVKVKADGDLNL